MTTQPNNPNLVTLLKKLGTIIQSERRRRGWSQTALAAQCRIHVSHLSKIERGGANATLCTLIKIAATLGVTLPELFQQLVPPDPGNTSTTSRP